MFGLKKNPDPKRTILTKKGNSQHIMEKNTKGAHKIHTLSNSLKYYYGNC